MNDAFIEESGRIWDEMEEQAEARDIRIQEWAKLAFDSRREIIECFANIGIDTLHTLFPYEIWNYATWLIGSDIEDTDDLLREIANAFFDSRNLETNKNLKAYILKQLEGYADGFVE